MIENVKTLLVQTISYLALYEIATLLAIFFIFIMIFTLGLLLRGRKFIARFFFFLSILVVCSTPFALRYVMQKVLYASEVNITSAHAMQYTNGFFVAGDITHNGKVDVNECSIVVNEVRDENGIMLFKILNSIIPKSSSSTNIELDIGVGETKSFAVIVPNIKAKEPFLYRIYVDCYLSNKFAQKMQKPQKSSAGIITPKPLQNTTDIMEDSLPQEVLDQDNEENQEDTEIESTQAPAGPSLDLLENTESLPE
ncbi:MAG: DUF2393 domain-containing protein [Helicobacter japonicus]|nr:DUF2393 domain-containing protein [Helicobacter japonicus]